MEYKKTALLSEHYVYSSNLYSSGIEVLTN